VADDDLREAERAWLADEADQAALARYIAALRRAGRPVTHDLLERQVHPPRTFDAPVALEVSVTLPDGRVRRLGRTPSRDGRGLELPEHRALSLGVADLCDLDSVARTIAPLDGVHLALDLDDAARLDPLVAAPQESLWLGCAGRLTPALSSAVAAMPRLAQLWVNAEDLVGAPDVEPLRRASCLSWLHLDAATSPGLLEALGRLPSLQELEVVEYERDEGQRLPEKSSAELAALAPLRNLRRLDLGYANGWKLDDEAIRLLSSHRRLTSLRLPKGAYSTQGLEPLVRLPLEDLRWCPAHEVDDPAPLLLRLKHLRSLEARLARRSLEQLPTQLEVLDVEPPAGSLAWLDRLNALRELRLSLGEEHTVEDLSSLGRLTQLRSLCVFSMVGRRAFDEGRGTTAAHLGHLRTCPHIDKLWLYRVLFDRPDEVAAVAALPVRSLTLSSSTMGDATARCLARSTTLETLTIHGNEEESLGAEGLRVLATIPTLRELVVTDCPLLTGDIVAAVARDRPDLVIRDDI
jgi:hypothetical protein